MTCSPGGMRLVCRGLGTPHGSGEASRVLVGACWTPCPGRWLSLFCGLSEAPVWVFYMTPLDSNLLRASSRLGRRHAGGGAPQSAVWESVAAPSCPWHNEDPPPHFLSSEPCRRGPRPTALTEGAAVKANSLFPSKLIDWIFLYE